MAVNNKSKTKLLIVDDSRFFRTLIEDFINKDKIEIIGEAYNGIQALKIIKRIRPDVITLDIDMPGMNGLQTLIEITKFNKQSSELPPIEVIMVSAYTKHNAEMTLQALNLGAVDFIEKAHFDSEQTTINYLKSQLEMKIGVIRMRQTCFAGNKSPVYRTKPSALTRQEALKTPLNYQCKAVKQMVKQRKAPIAAGAIFIGISTGGPKALNDMLPALCDMTNLPIFIVQHMPPGFTTIMADRLDTLCSHKVVEVTSQTPVYMKHVYLAQGGIHMGVRVANNDLLVYTIDMPPENGCKPCADILFRTAAKTYKSQAIGVVLTGMGCDGTKGGKIMKDNGARIIAQDQHSSTIWGMPASIINAGHVDVITSLMGVPGVVHSMLNKR